jgi:uncharacterized repeat protein (TIGR03803 family)
MFKQLEFLGVPPCIRVVGNVIYSPRMCTLAVMWILFAIPIAAQTFTTIYTFAGRPNDGAIPGGLTLTSGRTLYAVTGEGGSSNVGTAFSLAPPLSPAGAWTGTVLYNFAGGVGDTGSLPALTDHIGDLYGFRIAGGIRELGTVFALTPPAAPGGVWTENVLYSSSSRENGAAPSGPLVITGGALCGVTSAGGTLSLGTVYSLTPPATPGTHWSHAVLHTFAGGPGDGAEPTGSLTVGNDGVLYGTTDFGGTFDYGTVFSLTPPASPGGAWTETVLYSFKGGTDASLPNGNLVIGSGGVLYGTTSSGGDSDFGTVYSVAPPASTGAPWTETVLHRFSGYPDGGLPGAGVVIGAGGVLYGATPYGGSSSDAGTVYSLTPPASSGDSWTEMILHSFSNDSDGCNPTYLVIGNEGVLYGTTSACGNYNCSPHGCGTIYSLTP